MSFILRIYLYGLLAVVPSGETGPVNVLLVDARQPYALSNGEIMEEHVPMLIARAGSCKPVESCSGQVQELADIIFPVPSENTFASGFDQLSDRIQQGGAWLLDNSDLSLRIENREAEEGKLGLHFVGRPLGGGKLAAPNLPTGPQQAGAFAWIAAISELTTESGGAEVDPDVLAKNPKKDLISGRIRFDQGKIGTYRLVEYKGQVASLEFRTLSRPKHSKGAPAVLRRHSKSTSAVPGDSRAFAEAMVVEIEVQGERVAFLEQSFSSDRTREMILEPESRDGKRVVEVAILNAPLSTFSLSETEQLGHGHAPEEGAHFEIFYELLAHRPPNHLRPVPVVSKGARGRLPQVKIEGGSLLDALFSSLRGSIARPICPGACFGSCWAG